MANTASARKRNRQTERRTERNQARKSRMRTFIKKVEVAIAGGNKEAATEALRAAQPEMQRAAGKGVAHLNTVARKLSRLSARIKAISSGVSAAAGPVGRAAPMPMDDGRRGSRSLIEIDSRGLRQDLILRMPTVLSTVSGNLVAYYFAAVRPRQIPIATVCERDIIISGLATGWWSVDLSNYRRAAGSGSERLG